MTSSRATARENGPARRGRGRQDGHHQDKQCASVDSNTHARSFIGGADEEQCHPRKIFIGGLAHKTTTQHLRDHFGQFGAIVDAVVLRWPDGRSRGFGYVTLGDGVAVAAVLRETHQLSGRDVDVKRAVPGTNKLFVGGLPQNTTANELREHFEKFGVVSDAVVMIDPATSRSRGFGFVCFLPGQEGAAAVTTSLQQYDNHRIRGKWIEVKSAAPPHKLAAKNAQAGPSYEELALAGALPGNSRLTPSPSPSIENREPNQRKTNVSSMGSPRKVELSGLGSLSQSVPPGLTAQGSFNEKPKSSEMMTGQMPWWSAQPWAQPFPSGFGQLPQFPGPVGFDHYADGYAAGMHSPWSPPGTEQSGLSASFQQNLEQFLRQSTQQKMEWGTHKGTERDPSVSTACSTAEIAHAAAMLP